MLCPHSGDASAPAESVAPSSELGAAVRSVPQLIAAMGPGGDLTRFGRVVRAMGAQSSQTLILRLQTTPDPLLLWALHLELDKRNIPPCLRWPANDATQQAEFITLLADLLWFAKRNAAHQPMFKGWRGVFSNLPASAGWHAAAHRQYQFVAARYSLSHWCSKGLGLTDAQRRDLMALQTTAMRADRHQLRGAAFQSIIECLQLHALDRPDKAGIFTADRVATRRAMMWRAYVLAGHSQTRAARYWELITGERLSRQAVTKQLAMVADILRNERRRRPSA